VHMTREGASGLSGASDSDSDRSAQTKRTGGGIMQLTQHTRQGRRWAACPGLGDSKIDRSTKHGQGRGCKAHLTREGMGGLSRKSKPSTSSMPMAFNCSSSPRTASVRGSWGAQRGGGHSLHRASVGGATACTGSACCCSVPMHALSSSKGADRLPPQSSPHSRSAQVLGAALTQAPGPWPALTASPQSLPCLGHGPHSLASVAVLASMHLGHGPSAPMGRPSGS